MAWSLCSLSAVAVGRTLDPYPCASSIVMVKVSPKVPFSSFGFAPVPHVPHFSGSLVHIIHVVAVIKSGELRVLTEISLTKLVSDIIVAKIAASNGHCDFKKTASPTIIETTIDLLERSVLDRDGVKRSVNSFGFVDTEKREGAVAELIAFKGVAVVAWEPASPVVFIVRPNGGLEGESTLERNQVSPEALSGNLTYKKHQEQCQQHFCHLLNVNIILGNKFLRDK